MKTRCVSVVCLLFLFFRLLSGLLLTEQKKNHVRVQTNLILAICKNDLFAVKRAVAEGADVTRDVGLIDSWSEQCPLPLAAQYGYLDIARLLVAEGASVNCRGLYGTTPLMRACQTGHVPMIKWLLQRGARVDNQDDDSSALYEACSCGHLEAAQLLLRYKANVNSRDTILNRTPLFIASARGYPEIVRLLLNNGAEVNAKNRDGETALTWARYSKPGDAVTALLIAAGAHK